MKSKFPLVSVLILTYNRTDLLKNCLDSAINSSYPNLEFIISDNESDKENIKDFIKENYPRKKITVVRLKKNKGLTGGFNFGYKFCLGKYVMLMCNDTTISKTGITSLVEMAEKDPKIGMVAPQVTQMRNPKLIHSAGSFLTSSGLLYHYGVHQLKSREIYKKPYYIFSSTGAGFLVRRETIKISELYSEDFFMAYDESDLCHRVWLSGYTIVYCPKAELKHFWSATVVSSTENINRLWYLNQRNLISSYLINFEAFNAFRFLLFVNLAFWVWLIIWILRGNFRFAFSLPKAYYWHLTNFGKTLKRRKYVQNKIRKISDQEYFIKTLINPPWRYYLIHIQKKYRDTKLPERVIYR